MAKSTETDDRAAQAYANYLAAQNSGSSGNTNAGGGSRAEQAYANYRAGKIGGGSTGGSNGAGRGGNPYENAAKAYMVGSSDLNNYTMDSWMEREIHNGGQMTQAYEDALARFMPGDELSFDNLEDQTNQWWEDFHAMYGDFADTFLNNWSDEDTVNAYNDENLQRALQLQARYQELSNFWNSATEANAAQNGGMYFSQDTLNALNGQYDSIMGELSRMSRGEAMDEGQWYYFKNKSDGVSMEDWYKQAEETVRKKQDTFKYWDDQRKAGTLRESDEQYYEKAKEALEEAQKQFGFASQWSDFDSKQGTDEEALVPYLWEKPAGVREEDWLATAQTGVKDADQKLQDIQAQIDAIDEQLHDLDNPTNPLYFDTTYGNLFNRPEVSREALEQQKADLEAQQAEAKKALEDAYGQLGIAQRYNGAKLDIQNHRERQAAANAATAPATMWISPYTQVNVSQQAPDVGYGNMALDLEDQLKGVEAEWLEAKRELDGLANGWTEQDIQNEIQRLAEAEGPAPEWEAPEQTQERLRQQAEANLQASGGKDTEARRAELEARIDELAQQGNTLYWQIDYAQKQAINDEDFQEILQRGDLAIDQFNDEFRERYIDNDAMSEQVLAGYAEMAKTDAMYYGAENLFNTGDAYAESRREKNLADVSIGEDWTEDEANWYRYLMGKGEKDKAFEFAESTNRRYNSAVLQEKLAGQQAFGAGVGRYYIDENGNRVKNEDFGFGDWLGNMGRGLWGYATSAANMPVAFADWMDKIATAALSETALGGNGYYAGRRDAWASDRSNARLAGRAEQLNLDSGTLSEKFGFLGGKGLGDLYQLGNSMFQSFVWGNGLAMGLEKGSAFLAGKGLGEALTREAAAEMAEAGTLSLFFGQAANSAFDEAINRGANAQQAAYISTLSGVAEVAGEKFSLENLLNQEKWLGSWWKSLLAQGGIEGSEEVFTDMLNQFGDSIAAQLTGGRTDMEHKLADLMSSGMSYSEASKKLWRDAAFDAAFDFIGGFISGGFSGQGQYMLNAGARAAAKGANAVYGQMNYNGKGMNSTSSMMEEARTKGGEAARVAGELEGKRMTNKRAQDLYQALENTDKATIRQAVSEQLQQRDSSLTGEKLTEMTDAAMAYALGNATKEQLDLLNGSETAKQVLFELQYGRNENGTTSWSRELKTTRVNPGSVADRLDEIRASEGLPAEFDRELNVNGEKMTISGITEHGLVQAKNSKDQTVDVEMSSLSPEQKQVIRYMKDNFGERAGAMLQTIEAANTNMTTGGLANVARAANVVWTISQNSSLAFDEAMIRRNTEYAQLFDSKALRTIWDIARQTTEQKQRRKAEGPDSSTYKNAVNGEKFVADGHVFEGFDIHDKNLSAEQKGIIKMAEMLSRLSNGRLVFNFYHGGDYGIYGAYQNGVINLDMDHVNEAGQSLVTLTMAHELTHYIESFNQADYAKLRDFVIDHLMQADGVTLAELIERKQARQPGLSKTGAISEIVADGCEMMLQDGSMIQDLAEMDESLFGKVADFVTKLLGEMKKAIGLAPARTAESKALQEHIDEMQKLWSKALKGALKSEQGYVTEEYYSREDNKKILGTRQQRMERAVQQARAEGVGEFINAEGQTVGVIGANNRMQFSLDTYRKGGRSTLEAYLRGQVKDKLLTQADADSMMEQMDALYKVCDDFDDGAYAPFSAWSHASVVTYDGKPVFSVVKQNGEYKLNLDFSLVCKKRRTLDAVFNEMIRQGIMDDFGMFQESIAKINDIIRDNGFEVACGLCFVDSKRYRQAMIADAFTMMYNKQVFSLVRKGAGQKLDYFNYGGNEQLVNTGTGIDTLADEDLDWTAVDKILKQGKTKTVEYKIAKYLKENPSARKLVQRGDFMSTRGFDALKTNNQELLSLYNSKKGAGGPKAAQSDVQYLNDIIQNNAFNQKAAYEVGGVRIQSFSDYIGRLCFDYIQMVGDLAAKKLPAHSYTKEFLFAQQFGLTGIKINMSLVPDVVQGAPAGLDKNGNYAWKDGQSFGSTVYDNNGSRMTAAEGFELAKRIQSAKGYSKNCGTIAVGVSDEHILKMLGDPDIRMIIPYHKSSLNHIVAAMNNIDKYEDYTLQQSTRKRSGGKWVKVSASEEFNYNEALQRTGDAKAAANEYLAWCKENGYLPKFDHTKGGHNFSEHENYYKLLEDFSCYDADGVTSTPQGAVQMVFPTEADAFGSMKDLIREGLEEDAMLQARQDKAVPEIVKQVQAVLPGFEQSIKEGKGKKKNAAKATQVNGAVTDQESKDGFYDAVTTSSNKPQFSREDRPDVLEFLNGQETIKTYKSMQLEDGKLYPPMAKVIKGVTVPSSELGVWEKADEHPELIKRDKNGKAKFALNKGKGQGSVDAAYNPYMHSSNLVLNDQFSSAYKRNLVTVECEIPVSELTSGYKAEFAKNSVGMLSWHTGTVAGQLRGAKGNQRMVYLTRWLKPVRIVSDAEVAGMYKELLDGTGVKVPNNVVPASLLTELEKAGVDIDYTGIDRQEGRGKQQFSMEDVVEQTDKLVAVHNVTEEKLRGALKLGGLPVPSIAIVKAKTGHSNYGPISLVFHRETVDPKANRKNKVYGADAWTPMMREVEYQVDTGKIVKFEQKIRELSKKIAGGTFEAASVVRQHGIEDVTRLNLDEMLEKLANDDAVRAAYAADKGIQVEAQTLEKEFHNYGNDVLRQFIDRIGEDQLRILEEQIETGEDISEEYMQALRDVLLGYYSAKSQATAEKRLDNFINRNLHIKFINSAYAYMLSGGETTSEIDRLATSNKLREAVSSKDVIEWLRPQLEGVIGEPGIRNERDRYTPSGTRRSFWQTHDTYTLANIVKAMTTGNSRGAGIHLGATHLQSITAKDYATLEEVKKDSGRLRKTSEEEYSAAVSKVDAQLEELVRAIAAYNHDESYMARETIGETIIEAARGKRTVSGLQQAFQKLSEYKLSTELAQQLIDAYDAAATLPTEYFEAKPQRAVGFDEVAAAILPDSVSEDILAGLQDAGVDVRTYEDGNEHARLEQLNSIDRVQFSREDRNNTQTAITTDYRQKVHDIYNNVISQSGATIMGYTPDLFIKMGMPSLPFVIGNGHIYSIAKTEAEARADGKWRRGVHYHGLGEAAVADLYAKIQNPVMIIAASDANNGTPMRSTHSIVAIVDIGSATDHLLMPVEITAERQIDHVSYDVNVLSSAYEKNPTNLITEAIRQYNIGQKSVYYVNRNAARLVTSGVQFPKMLQSIAASDGIVQQFPEKVNMAVGNSLQSTQFTRWFGDWQNHPERIPGELLNADGTPRIYYEQTSLAHSSVKGGFFTDRANESDGVYLRIKKPYMIDATSADSPAGYYNDHSSDIIRNAQSGNYDGVIIKGKNENLCIAFKETQAKSAEDNVGTYDGNNPSRFFSREDVAEKDLAKRLEESEKARGILEKALQTAKQQAEYYKNETEFPNKKGIHKADPADVRKFIDALLKEYSYATVKPKELYERAQRIADGFINQEDTQDLYNIALEMAREIIDSSYVRINDQMEIVGLDKKTSADEVKGHLKGYIYVAEQDRSDIATQLGADNWEQVRKRFFRYGIYLTNNLSAASKGGLRTIDSLYEEMAPGYGWDQTKLTMADMLETMEAAMTEDVVNPYTSDRSELSRLDVDFVAELAEEIFEGAISEDVRQYYTQAERAEQKLKAAREKGKEDVKAAVAAERQKGRERLAEQREQDRQKLREVKATNAERMRALREQKNQRMWEIIQEERQKRRDLVARNKETRARRDVRAKIWKLQAEAQQMVNRPTEKAYVPAPLMRAMAEMLSVVSSAELRQQESRMERLDRRLDEMRMDEETHDKKAAPIQKAIDRLADLQARYEAISKDEMYGYTYSEAVNGMLSQLKTYLYGTYLTDGDMSADTLKQIYNIMNALMFTVKNANKMKAMEFHEGIRECARALNTEMNHADAKRGLLSTYEKSRMWQMRPDTFFRYICGYAKNSIGEKVQQMFVEGTQRKLTLQRDFYNMFQGITEAKDAANRKAYNEMTQDPLKQLVSWGLTDTEGGEVFTTRGMMLQAYMLLEQEDSARSLAIGGFLLPNLKEYYHGNYQEAFGKFTVRTENRMQEYGDLLKQARELRESMEGKTEAEQAEIEQQIFETLGRANEIMAEATANIEQLKQNIEEKLTDFEKEIIRTAHEWYDYSGQKLDETNMDLYGFKKQRPKGYVPIHRDLSSVLSVDIRETQNTVNLENAGFTKSRVKSTNPIMLTDIFMELDGNQARMSNFYGFVKVQHDFNALWKCKIPGSNLTIEGKVNEKFGKGQKGLFPTGAAYVENYVKSVAGGGNQVNVMSGLYGNAAAATLSLNPKVALSQLASIPTAAAELGWAPVVKGLARGLRTGFSTKAKQELAQKSVWFWQRYRGEGGMREFAEIKNNRGTAVGRTWNKIASTRVGEALLGWCQDMDVLATASMWAMAEEYVKSQGIDINTEAGQQAVADAYRDTIRRTQPNYTATERSDLLRDQRAGLKFMTMYKTQSNQNLNILMEANGEFARTRRDFKAGAASQAEMNAATKKLANAWTAVIIGGSLTYAALRTVASFLMGALKAYRDDDDELTAESIRNGTMKEFYSSVAGMDAFTGILYDLLYSSFRGEKYYGISDNALGALSDTLTGASKAIQAIMDDEDGNEWDAIHKELQNLCTLAGIPLGNAEKFIDAAKMWYNDLQNGTFGQFEGNVERTAKQEVHRLLDAFRDGDTEKADTLFKTLQDQQKGGTDWKREQQAQKFVQGKVKTWYVEDAELTEDQAREILIAYGGMTEKEANEQLLEWQGILENGYDYGDAKDAFISGDLSEDELMLYATTYMGLKGQDADDAITNLRCEKDTGYSYSDLMQAYVDGAISEADAVKYRMEYGGYTKDEAQETVTKWRCEKETGVAYSRLEEAYVDGVISKQQAEAWQQKYGGLAKEKAQEKVLAWTCEKETGVAYNKIEEAYIAGKVTKQQVVAWEQKYGGHDKDKAEELLARYEFAKQTGVEWSQVHQGFKAGKLTEADLLRGYMTIAGMDREKAGDYVTVAIWKRDVDEGFTYEKLGKWQQGESKLIAAGVPKSLFAQVAEAWANDPNLKTDYTPEGKQVTDSKMRKVLAYIGKLDIPAEQKTALAYSFYKDGKKIRKYKTW